MKSLTIVAFSLCATATLASDKPFCYRDSEGCGPGTEAWSPLCHEGEKQTPIAIPDDLTIQGQVELRTNGTYRHSSFRMINNGHSIAFDFATGSSGQNEGPSSGVFQFPAPLNPQGPKRGYKFASAHFHWGTNNREGSEHTLGEKKYAMELHLVHYSANYSNMDEAVASGKSDALAVVGVWFIPGHRAPFGNGFGYSHPTLAPIVGNLDKIQHASHDDEWITVSFPLDLTPLLQAINQQVFIYEGGLTTPGCNEQVSWFMLKEPFQVTTFDLEAFRSYLLDSRGKPLDTNFRPIQATNGRQVILTNVKSVA